MYNVLQAVMYGRSTDHRESKKTKEIYSTAKAPNIEGMGAQWQRDRGCPQVSDSSPHSVLMEESTGTSGGDVSEWKTPPGRS